MGLRIESTRHFRVHPFVPRLRPKAHFVEALPRYWTTRRVEAASELSLDTRRVKRLGIPDRLIEHSERGELLTDLALNPAGIAAACRELAEQGERIGKLGVSAAAGTESLIAVPAQCRRTQRSQSCPE
jgi:hypothetical protein